MDLFENPFYILGITTRDPSPKVFQAAEEKSLLLDPEVCSQARGILTNPKHRISAEVAWVPGLAPIRVLKLIQKIVASPQEVVKALSGLAPLVRCNLGTSLITHLSFQNHSANLGEFLHGL